MIPDNALSQPSLVGRWIAHEKTGYDSTGKRHVDQLDRATIYDLPYHPIQDFPKLTTEVRRIADVTFPQLLPLLGRTKLEEKRLVWPRIIHALACASAEDGCVAYQCKTQKIVLEVIDAAERTGLIRNVRSPKGAPKMSRILPMPELIELFSRDPWCCDGERIVQFVFLKTRKNKETGEDGVEIEFDRSDPFPAEVQRKLSVVNATNSIVHISYAPFEKFERRRIGQRRLRPVHYAVFSEDWDRHGRIYTRKYGHQGLSQDDRQFIFFGNDDGIKERGVELDYSGFHTRMCYHLEGVEMNEDPYALWDATTPPMRLLAKLTINAALNATSPKSAISACNQAMNSRTETGEWKSGKARDDARLIREAVKETGLKFATIYDLARKRHERIDDYFGSDAGMRLMNIDGKIALDILYYFTSAGVPCLGIHDSFIVPECFESDLRIAMSDFYRQHVHGFSPIIKP